MRSCKYLIVVNIKIYSVGCLRTDLRGVFLVLPAERVLGHLVKMPHEENGHRSNGEEQDGRPEANFVDHLADKDPALHLLWV